MSGQFSDEYRYENKSYSTIDSAPFTVFDPREYGLKPDGNSCSACWRGYYAQFSIIEKRLFIEKLYVEDEDGKYPSISGIQVRFQDEVDYFTVFPVYEDLSLFVPYTGKLLAGDEFLDEYYIHSGYQRIWAYKDVKEFIFENGELKTVNDLSDIAAKLRKEAPQGTLDSIFFGLEETEAMKPYLNEWWSPAKEQKKWTLNEILLENSQKLREKNKK